MATVVIKSSNSDYQAFVDSTGHLLVTGSVSPIGTTNVNLTEVGGANIALGQALMAASLPVVIASNQTPVPVSQSTTPWVTSNSTLGAISGGTAGTQSSLAAGIYNSTSLTLLNGQQSSLQLDASGNLKVLSTGSSTVSGTVSTNINGLVAFQTSQYSATTTATQLTPTPMAGRTALSVKVSTTAGAVVYIGNSSAVTISTGYGLYNGDSIQLDLTGAQTIYAIASAGTQIVYVMEIGT